MYVHISPSNKYYVGITSRRPEERWRSGKGYKHNSHFTNAINKYGWDNFQHEIVASNLMENEAKNFEKLLISKLNSNNPNFGYNISAGGDGTVGVSHYGESNPFYGRHHSDETRKLLSDQRKGRTGEKCYFYGKHHSEETKLLLSTIKGRPVCQFDLDLNLVKEYRSAKFAATETGIYHSMILGCCNKTKGYVTAGGFVWMYTDDVSESNIDAYRMRLQHDKLPKPVCQFTLNMEFITEHSSIADASRTCNIPAPDISNSANKKVQTAGGYIWIFSQEYKQMLDGEIAMRKPFRYSFWKEVCKFSLDGTLLERYPNRIIASNSVGVSPQAIGSACKSKSHFCKNHLWYFASDIENEVA